MNNKKIFLFSEILSLQPISENLFISQTYSKTSMGQWTFIFRGIIKFLLRGRDIGLLVTVYEFRSKLDIFINLIRKQIDRVFI